jgi:hypothetical protein
MDDKNLSAHLAIFKLEMVAGRIDVALARATMVIALDQYSPVGDRLPGDA